MFWTNYGNVPSTNTRVAKHRRQSVEGFQLGGGLDYFLFKFESKIRRNFVLFFKLSGIFHLSEAVNEFSLSEAS